MAPALRRRPRRWRGANPTPLRSHALHTLNASTPSHVPLADELSLVCCSLTYRLLRRHSSSAHNKTGELHAQAATNKVGA